MWHSTIRTGLMVTVAALCGAALFILFMTLYGNSVKWPRPATLGSSAVPMWPMPVIYSEDPFDRNSKPNAVTWPQQLPSFHKGEQAAMTVTAIDHLTAASSHITAMTVDRRGRWWIGTEGQGVFRYAPTNRRGHRWRQFTSRSFAPNNVYALACDGMGRIWAGSLRHGVSVYNGAHWRNYDLIAGQGYGHLVRAVSLHQAGTAAGQAVDSTAYLSTTARAGPLGQRIFGIAISPIDGDIWIATAKGLTRYRVHKNIWQYYTRAAGLPANQLSCLAFAPDGNLFVGTQCNGIAVGRALSHYRKWTHISAPLHPPTKGWGVGLPDNRINALVVVPRGIHHGQTAYRVYAGTDSGLAFGEENGQLWQYVRGRNYTVKVKWLWHTPPHWMPPPPAVLHSMLTSDYVTTLATDADGNIWIGHRTTGFEILNQHNTRIFPAENSANNVTAHDFIASMAPLPDGGMLIGGYQSGLFRARVSIRGGKRTRFKAAGKISNFPPLPAGARAPTAAAIQKCLAQVKAGQGRPMEAAGLGADWRTEGDWLGHYGVAYARLCAGTPTFYNAAEEFAGALGVDIIRESSPHQLPYHGDVAYYVSWYHSPELRTLYFPNLQQRVEAEWNDAGGRYPRLFDGPDMWLKVRIPKGLYRLSFYFHNKDGQSGINDTRDYLVQLYPKGNSPAQAWAYQRPLATSRVMQFWGGMYCRFLISGPGTYQVRLDRNYGYWMTVAGMFLDHITGPKNLVGYTQLDGLPVSTYRPADPQLDRMITQSGAYRLWRRLNEIRSYSAADISAQWTDRILAYRFAEVHDFPPALLERWRWKLCLWLPSDRRAFNLAVQGIPPPNLPVVSGK